MTLADTRARTHAFMASLKPGEFASLCDRIRRILNSVDIRRSLATAQGAKFDLSAAVASAVIGPPADQHGRRDSDSNRQRIDAAKAWLCASRAEDARPIGSGRDLQPYLMPGLTNTRPKDHPDRWATAIHEASHAVAATALGHEAKIESGRVNRNCSGEIVFTTIESIPPEHDATIDAAGVFTEMKIDASTNAARSWRTGQPENDRAKFDAALAKIRDREGNPVKHDSDAASRLINSAEFLVDQHYAAVVAIACLLYDAVDSDVGGEDIVLLYAWHEWPEFAQDRQHLHDWHSPDKLDRLRAGNFD